MSSSTAKAVVHLEQKHIDHRAQVLLAKDEAGWGNATYSSELELA